MNNKSEIEQFISNVEDSWQEIRSRSGTVKAANAKQDANRKLFNQWVKEGRTIEMLFPLLEHSSNAVKLPAAAWLLDPSVLDNEVREKAIEVLRYLVKNDPTLVSCSAAAVLRVHKIKPE